MQKKSNIRQVRCFKKLFSWNFDKNWQLLLPKWKVYFFETVYIEQNTNKVVIKILQGSVVNKRC